MARSFNTYPAVGRLIATAWTDPEFVGKFDADPAGALTKLGISAAPDMRIVLRQNDAATVYLVLSGPPRSAQNSVQCEIRSFGEVYRDPKLWSLNWRARDPVARQRLIDDPRGELVKIGVRYLDDLTLVMLLNAVDVVHLVIPERPAGVAAALLARIAAGSVPPTLRLGRLIDDSSRSRILQGLVASPMPAGLAS